MHSSKSLDKMTQRKNYGFDSESQRDTRRHPDAKRVDRERADARRSKRDWE
jgi:hypothetical protein